MCQIDSALINHSRIRRLIGVVGQKNKGNLKEAAETASRFANEKCSILCALEMAEFRFAVHQMGEALDMALELLPSNLAYQDAAFVKNLRPSPFPVWAKPLFIRC